MKNENIFDFYSNDLGSKSTSTNNDDDNDDNNDNGVVVVAENEKQNKKVTEIKNKCSQLNDSDN